MEDMVWNKDSLTLPERRWAGDNRNGYVNPRADELYFATQSSLDEETRKQRYADYVEQLSQDAPHMWVANPNEIWAATSKLRLPSKKLGFLLLTNVKDWELSA